MKVSVVRYQKIGNNSRFQTKSKVSKAPVFKDC